jgi:outer membrane receptor protein involved in Fe transport
MIKENKIISFFLPLILLPFLLVAAEIRGKVKDIYNQPLPGITIRVIESGQTAFTNGQGAFVISLDDAPASVQIYFESSQYYRENRTVHLKDLTGDLEIFLIPLKLLKEDVTVTALNEAEKAISVPFAQNVVSKIEIRENMPETIVQALQNSPGIHFIGKGGVSVTPSIRGLARRRILLLANGARIISDRSAGASAQFFPPELVQQIEVVRSAASVLYGSDAIGGVINIISRNGRNPEANIGSLNFSGNSANSKINGGLSINRKFGNFSLLADLQISQADDYSSAKERILNSGFSYYTGNLVFGYENDQRDFSVNFLKSYGKNIGKPERANDPSVSSFYPVEDTNLLNLVYNEKSLAADSTLGFSLFLNPNHYELDKFKAASRQNDISRNNALDFGIRAAFKKGINKNLSYQFGVDYFGRSNVDMENETWKKDVLSSTSFPVENGKRSDLGMFFTLDYSGLSMLDLVAGARYGFFSRNAISDGHYLEKSSHAPAFFIGVTRKIQDYLTLFFNLGTAFRMPSLSEAFYTGITGRNSIVGNAALNSESSLNLDAGMKIHRKNMFLGIYLFKCSIKDMIEKFPLSDTSYTYNNIEQGRIQGMEVEFQMYPIKNLELFGNGFYYHGKSTASDQHLNDVPSAKVFLGVKYWLGRFWSELNWLASAAMKHPGPAETTIPAFNVADIKAGYYFSNRLFLFFKIANLFNRYYIANADPDIPPAKGFDFSLGLNVNF